MRQLTTMSSRTSNSIVVELTEVQEYGEFVHMLLFENGEVYGHENISNVPRDQIGNLLKQIARGESSKYKNITWKRVEDK